MDYIEIKLKKIDINHSFDFENSEKKTFFTNHKIIDKLIRRKF